MNNILSAEIPKEQSTLTEVERQDLLLEKLDLSGLETWPKDQAEKARGLLKEYHDIFSVEKQTWATPRPLNTELFTKILTLPHSRRDSTEFHLHNLMMLDAGCWCDPAKQQPMVQCCCVGEKERWVTPFLYQL